MTELGDSLDLLAERGQPRGADAVFQDAATGRSLVRVGSPDARASRKRAATLRRVWIGVGAAAAIALFAGIVSIGGGPTREVQSGAGSQVAAPAPSGSGTEVLGLAELPPGYKIVHARTTGGSSLADDSRAGSLRAFQRPSANGNMVDQVLAVAVTRSKQQTSLDYFSGDEGSQSMSQVEGREVARYSATSGYADAQFEFARWQETNGDIVKVAGRSIDGPTFEAVVAAVVRGAGTVPADAVPAGLVEVETKALGVPQPPGQTGTRLTLKRGDGATVVIGTEPGSWPSASDFLWWADGSRLVGSNDHALLLERSTAPIDGGPYIYRSVPGGAVSVRSTDLSVSDQLGLTDLIQPVPLTQWQALAGEADDSATNVLTTDPPKSGGN